MNRVLWQPKDDRHQSGSEVTRNAGGALFGHGGWPRVSVPLIGAMCFVVCLASQADVVVTEAVVAGFRDKVVVLESHSSNAVHV